MTAGPHAESIPKCLVSMACLLYRLGLECCGSRQLYNAFFSIWQLPIFSQADDLLGDCSLLQLLDLQPPIMQSMLTRNLS